MLFAFHLWKPDGDKHAARLLPLCLQQIDSAILFIPPPSFLQGLVPGRADHDSLCTVTKQAVRLLAQFQKS